MPETGTVLDALAGAIEKAGTWNGYDQVRPEAVLWTDRDRQWEAILPRLRDRLPILQLGPYDPDAGIGPAYWIRFALASVAPDDSTRPVIYLPGVSRQELRAVEECPVHLRPIAELQYRSVFFSHRNGRDWSVAAFLGSEDGLGIEVDGDNATREALLNALGRLMDTPVVRLRREAPLRAETFHAMLNPDEAKSLLDWLEDPVAFRAATSPESWAAFVQVANSRYGFDPDRDGPITAAGLLGGREGYWVTVWDRFREGPGRYPSVHGLLKAAKPAASAQLGLFAAQDAGSWPQDNEAGEDALRRALLELDGVVANEARERIDALEEDHKGRRNWVWADLGQAPLAAALKELSTLRCLVDSPVGGITAREVGEVWAERGWQADNVALGAMASVEGENAKAVGTALRAIYRPWLETCANALQGVWASAEPGLPAPEQLPAGTCLLFADGLRFDLANRLVEELGATTRSEMDWAFGPQPGVTPTAKPAVSPIASRVGPGSGFDTVVLATGTKLTAEGMRKLLAADGWQPLGPAEIGDPSGKAWTECGHLDAYGHGHGAALARHAQVEVRAVASRIRQLLNGGWTRVRVVTDHGWLLLPGGLPKADLPEHLTEVRKGRCARLKPDAVSGEMAVTWRWDPSVRVAVARGIACYEAGKEYEHGGISPQETVLPVLDVWPAQLTGGVEIESVTWRGLRATVGVTGAPAGALVDLRTRAADPGSTLAVMPKQVDGGQASPVVEDEDREGQAVHVVVLDQAGVVLAQLVTTVGG
jgi:hypothetical protein